MLRKPVICIIASLLFVLCPQQGVCKKKVQSENLTVTYFLTYDDYVQGNGCEADVSMHRRSIKGKNKLEKFDYSFSSTESGLDSLLRDSVFAVKTAEGLYVNIHRLKIDYYPFTRSYAKAYLGQNKGEIFFVSCSLHFGDSAYYAIPATPKTATMYCIVYEQRPIIDEGPWEYLYLVNGAAKKVRLLSEYDVSHILEGFPSALERFTGQKKRFAKPKYTADIVVPLLTEIGWIKLTSN